MVDSLPSIKLAPRLAWLRGEEAKDPNSANSRRARVPRSVRRHWKLNLWFDGYRLCHWCRQTMVWPQKKHERCVPDFCTLEHVVPLSEGGVDGPGNLVLACRSCNELRTNADLRARIEAGDGEAVRRELMEKENNT